MICELKILFGTPVWIFDLEENDKQLNTMVMMDGQNFSLYVNNQKQILNTADFDSNNYDFFAYEGYGIERLKQYVNESIEKIRQDRKWPETTAQIKARRTIIKPLECDTPHHHLGLDLVGIYYVQVPENSGELLLYETRGSVNNIWEDPHVTADSMGRTGRVCYRFKPSAGKLIMFPSYLFHSVETNLSNDMRISIVLDIRLSVNTNSY
jgi:uncharacterized protein (TIGR02466 family)